MAERKRLRKRFKTLMKKNSDPYLALLAYRTTPLHNGHSPAELCMGRRLRTTLPVAPHTLEPRNTPLIRDKENAYKLKMKMDYDRRHRAQVLPPLKPNDNVVIRDNKTPATVVQPAENSPRSYIVKTPSKIMRRNRRSLLQIPQSTSTPADESTNKNVEKPAKNPAIMTRSGRISKPPDRLNTPEIEQ